MTSDFQIQLIQKLSPHQELLRAIPQETQQTQWKGRSISKVKKLQTQISSLINSEENERLTDTQLLNRVCTLCKIAPGEQEKLMSLCSSSPDEAATSLTETLLNIISSKQQTDDYFYQNLQEWTAKAGINENRAEAAKRISTAYESDDPNLDLSNLELRSLPDSIKELQILKNLNLSSNSLKKLPEAITHLTQLKTLNLTRNTILTFPTFFSKSHQLEELDFSFNRLYEIPSSFSQLTQLKTLNLQSNRFKDLPECISSLPQLKNLNLEGNSISEIPDSITQLSQLEHLNCAYNEIKKIPKTINQVTRLKSLNLECNQLQKLPNSIVKLTQLEQLNCSENEISELPDGFDQLTQLKKLNIGINQIEELPDTLNRLSHLTELEIHDNALTKLPVKLNALTQLEVLNIKNIDLDVVPDSINQLTKLKTLDCSSNQLKKLPNTINQLKCLESLHFSDNNIAELPDTLNQLPHLKILSIGGNPISEIPNTISKLNQLKELNCSKIKLSTLPDTLKKLSNLTLLNISNNPLIKHVPNYLFNANRECTVNIGDTPLSKNLSGTRRIYLKKHDQKDDTVFKEQLRKWENAGEDDENRAAAVDRIFYAYHNNSSTLDLNNLGLKSLPDSLQELTRLNSLKLDNNQIKTFPETLNKIPHLETLSLQNNQLSALWNKTTKQISIKNLNLANNQFTKLPNIFDTTPKLESINLEKNQLTTLTSTFESLTQLKTINLVNNKLTGLPNIFENLTELNKVLLDNNPLDHFPNALYSIEQPLSVSIACTPILNTLFTPQLKVKLHKNKWKISGESNEQSKPSFNNYKEKYIERLKSAKEHKISPDDYEKTLQIHSKAHTSLPKEELVHNTKRKDISKSHLRDTKRIRSQEDAQLLFSKCQLDNQRFIACGNDNAPINIIACACPALYFSSELDDEEKRRKEYLDTLTNLCNESDTVISLVVRDTENRSVPFLMDCSIDASTPPEKLLSMPIPDFVPPRFEHYLTLAEEMNIPQSVNKPKGILIFCGVGEGRTGTLLAATQIIDNFRKLNSESRKDLLRTIRNFTPSIFGGTFSRLTSDFKTTAYVGNIVQDIRQLEQETTKKGVGISVETPEQFQSLELLQCMLAISEKLKDTPPISDEQILQIINDNNFNRETLEVFFQIDYEVRHKEDVILESVKKLHQTFSKE